MAFSLASVSIRARLIALSLISLIGFSFLFALEIAERWTEINDARQRELRSLVESAIAISAKLDEKVKQGVMTVDQAQGQARAQISLMRYRGNEYFFITDMTPKMVMHPIKPELDGKDVSGNKDPNGKLLFQEFVRVVRESGSGVVDYLWPRPGSDQPVSKVSYVQGYAPWGWVVGTGVYTDDLNQIFWDAVTEMLIKVGLAVALILAATVMLIRSITNPLNALSGVMSAMADNETNVTVPGTDRRDEIGVMARTVEVFKQALISKGEADARTQTEIREKEELARRRDALIATFEKTVETLTERLIQAGGAMEG